MSFNPASDRISSASDVAFSNPTTNNVMVYNSQLAKWQNAPVSSLLNTVGVQVTDYGVLPNSNTDQRAVIQACLDTYKSICFPAGTYRCSSALQVEAGMTIYLAANAKLLRDNTNVTRNGALIRNKAFTTVGKADNVVIWGPGTLGALDTTKQGTIVNLYGDGIRLDDFTIDTYAGGGAVVLAGDKIHVHNVRAINSGTSTATTGIHFSGGDQFVATACHIESGGEAYQFAPITTSGDPLIHRDITNSSFIGCTGSSSNARLMAVNNQATGTATPSITNVGFFSCYGSGGTSAVMIQNPSTAGTLRNVVLRDCTINMATGTGVTGEITINGYTGNGIDGVTLDNVSVNEPTASSLSIMQKVQNSVIKHCTFKRVATGGTNRLSPVINISGINTRVIGGYFNGDDANANVIVIGKNPTDGPVSERAIVSEARITGIFNTKFGIAVSDCDDPRISDCQFEQKSDATTARAISLAATVGGARVDNNNVRSLIAASKYTDSASGTIYTNNIG